ncbi:MAG: RluA family pseudouridine synthase [Hyphomicrobiales bacterium]
MAVTQAETIRVAPSEGGMRLDRWFKARYPALGHVALQKLLRTGQVRVDGRRVKAAARTIAGQRVRVPPLGPGKTIVRRHMPGPYDAQKVRSWIVHQDDEVIVLNKPAGLAVQGGAKTAHHLDGMLDALAFGAERPRLVHRLDRDTGGVLVLARNRQAAIALGSSFKSRKVVKVYWALVRGAPKPHRGRIDLPLAPSGHGGSRRMAPARLDNADAQDALTHYRTIAAAGAKVAWVALYPKTGRKHQLRAHMSAIGHPVLGDGKYGGQSAFIADDLARRVHLYARALRIPHPAGGTLEAVAELCDHMRESFAYFDFSPEDAAEPFGIQSGLHSNRTTIPL